MIIRVADKDVENHPREHLTQCVFGVGKSPPDDLRQLGVTCMRGHNFIKTKKRQRGDQHLPGPTCFEVLAVKAFDQKDISAH